MELTLWEGDGQWTSKQITYREKPVGSVKKTRHSWPGLWLPFQPCFPRVPISHLMPKSTEPSSTNHSVMLFLLLRKCSPFFPLSSLPRLNPGITFSVTLGTQASLLAYPPSKVLCPHLSLHSVYLPHYTEVPIYTQVFPTRP